MSTANAHTDSKAPHKSPTYPDLIPREFLRVIAVWSLIPAYILVGGFLGYLVDRWLHTWPFGMGVGLIVALGFAVRDMLRLRDTL